jgi:hypothetical protein
MLSILTFDALLTSISGSYRGRLKHTGKGIAVKHGIDAQAIMMI